MDPLGIGQANCFRTHNELTMGLLGKCPLAPSVKIGSCRSNFLPGMSTVRASYQCLIIIRIPATATSHTGIWIDLNVLGSKYFIYLPPRLRGRGVLFLLLRWMPVRVGLANGVSILWAPKFTLPLQRLPRFEGHCLQAFAIWVCLTYNLYSIQ